MYGAGRSLQPLRNNLKDKESIVMLIECIGYLGSVLVVVSMLMSSVVKLRVINTVGSCISGTYALVIHSYPLALMNLCLIVINFYNLAKLLKSEQHYDLISGRTDDAYFTYFLNHYKNDILHFFPEADSTLTNLAALGNTHTVFIICCDTVPAGILLGTLLENGTFAITVDYTTPMYRDCSAGRFLYARLPENGIRTLAYMGNSDRHVPYLQKMA